MATDRHPAYYPYIGSLAFLGAGILTVSAPLLIRGEIDYHWMFLTLLTVLTSAFPIKVPEIDFKVSIEDTFFFTNLILFGVEVGVITAALQGFMGSIRAKSNSRRLEFSLFNIGGLITSAYISGAVFFWLYEPGPLFGNPPENLRQIVLPIAMLASMHYLLNSASVALVIALDTRQNIYEVWRGNLSWSWLTYLTGASVVALIAMNVRTFSVIIFMATVPIVLVTYFTYKTYRDRVESHLRQLRELNGLYLRAVESLALAVDAKDQTTHGHIRRVRAYALGLARHCGITDKNELLAIETGALLHDIGKLAIEDYILNKPGKLSQQEYERMKHHTSAGEEIVRQIEFPFPAATYVRGHHERWDGGGYPDGLKGKAIPLGCRILALADSYDAMKSSRPYRKGRESSEAMDELRDSAGTQFDPELAGIFIAHLEELECAAAEATKGISELSFRKRSDTGPLPTPQVTHFETSRGEVTGELVSLSEFCSGLAQSMDLADSFAEIERRLRRILPYDSCAFFVPTGEGVIRAEHAAGRLREKLQGLQIGLGKNISGWVAAYMRPMLNTSPLLEFMGCTGDFSDLHDILVVPMIHGNSSAGTISIYAGAGTRYTSEQLLILQMVASICAPLVARTPAQPARDVKPKLDDPISGAKTARYLGLAATQWMDAALSANTRFHIIFVRLANLFEITNSLGSPVRDCILREAAAALSAEIRGSDLLARYGENGFVILLAGAKPEPLDRRLLRLQELIAAIEVQGGNSLCCELGAACFPDDGSDFISLLVAAQDLAGRRESDAARAAAGGARIFDFRLSGSSDETTA